MKKLLLGALCAISPVGASAQETPTNAAYTKDYFDGRPNVQAGDRFEVRYFIRSRISQNLPQETVNGKGPGSISISASTIVKFGGDYQIIAFDAARGGTARLTFDNFTVTANSNSRNFDMVAQNREANRLLSAISGATLGTNFAPNGKVTKIFGADALQNRILRALPASVPAEARAQLKARFSEILSEKSLRESLETGNAMIPPQPVRLGESWRYSSKSSNGLNVRGSYKLISLQNGMAVLREASNLSLTEKMEGLDAPFRGVQNSTQRVDNISGQLLEYNGIQRLTGQIPLPDFGPKVSMPIWIRSETRIVMEPKN